MDYHNSWQNLFEMFQSHLSSFKQCIFYFEYINVTVKVYDRYIVVHVTRQTRSKVYPILESCFNKFHWKQTLSSLYYTSISHQWFKVKCFIGSSACEVFPIKLYLTATCACVYLMSSKVEWDCGMSATLSLPDKEMSINNKSPSS